LNTRHKSSLLDLPVTKLTHLAAGLERSFRFIQALIQVFASIPLAHATLLSTLSLIQSSHGPADAAATQAALGGLRSRIALGRRFFRIFRFAESFSTAWALFYASSSPSASPSHRPAELWLDISARSFNGMYLLLETLGFADALGAEGFAPLGKEWERVVHVEGQRFWFLALVCAVGAGLVRLVKVFAYAPVPESGEGFGDGSEKMGRKTEDKGEDQGEGQGENGEGEKGEGEKDAASPSSPWDDWEGERARLRKVVVERKAHRKRWRRDVARRSRRIVRRLAADALDLFVPGAVIGWVPASAGTVGLAMLGSTYLTGLEIWERCGREIAAAREQPV
jgi:hypothetical protein